MKPSTNKKIEEDQEIGRKMGTPRNRPRPDIQPLRWRLTARDQLIVKEVYTHRVLTTYQIYDLVFSPNNPGPPRNGISRCRHRVKLLHKSGYLARREQPSIKSENKPYLYMLDKNAIPLLAKILEIFPESIDWKPKYNRLKPQSVNHLLVGNDVRVALEIAGRRHKLTLIYWIDDLYLRSTPDDLPELPIDGPKGNIVWKRKIPDGYFRLNSGECDLDHFLEIDMGTEPMRAIKEKAEWYVAYYRHGWHEEVYGLEPDNLTVLFITIGPRRMENIKRVFEGVGADDRFWFTTFEEAVPQAILDRPIWAVAGGKVKRTFFDED